MKLTNEIWTSFGYTQTESSAGKIWFRRIGDDYSYPSEEINEELNLVGGFFIGAGIQFPFDKNSMKKFNSFYKVKCEKFVSTLEELVKLERKITEIVAYNSGQEDLRIEIKDLLRVRECNHEED